jgi:hypothetical protein
MSEQTIAPVTSSASGRGNRRVGSLIGGSILCVLAVVFLAGGTWALWVDRVDRGGGFVTIGTTKLNTGTYAFESPLHGDGPRWFYGRTVFGTTRVRATSQTAHPLFIGIARTDDVSRYLEGTGYATIQHLAFGDVTTHEGGAPSAPPTSTPIWVASTQGNGRQTLLWKPRSGDWSIVLMNTDASPGVELRGDLGAKFPLAPWVAGGLLLVGAVLGCLGSWLLVRGIRMARPAVPVAIDQSQSTSTTVPVAAPGKEEVNA